MTVMLRRDFLAPWTGVHAAFTAIVANPVLRVMIGHAAVINMIKMSPAKIVYRPVVVKFAASPFSPDKPEAIVTKPVINAAVETHMWAPISGMPDKDVSTPAPITGR